MSLASSTTVAVSLFVLAVFLLVAVNVDNLARTIESGLEVRLYLAEELDPLALASLEADVAAIDGVTSVTFVSKEEALNTLRQQLGKDSDLLEGVDAMNPLRNSLRVVTRGPAWVDSVVATARTLSGIADVSYTHDLAQRILNLVTAIRLGGLILVSLMILATLFVISNTVRLTILARGDEVAIMRLVGATNWFIRWPFLFEGMFLGFAGAGLAALAAWQVYVLAVGGVYANLSFMPVVPVYPLAWRLGLILLGLGVIVGGFGSAISLRRFLRV
jgi:cell division transport system permease protein